MKYRRPPDSRDRDHFSVRDVVASYNAGAPAAWLCNDLWNLLPSAPAVNRSKGDRLPAAEALERSRFWIPDWWDLAYRRDIALRNQFEDEARSALPSAVFGPEETAAPEDVFEELMVQQMVLRRDQQLAVWQP